MKAVGNLAMAAIIIGIPYGGGIIANEFGTWQSYTSCAVVSFVLYWVIGKAMLAAAQ